VKYAMDHQLGLFYIGFFSRNLRDDKNDVCWGIYFWVQTLEGCSIKLHAGTKIKSSWVKSAESSLQFVSSKAFPQKLNVLKKDLYDKNNASHDLKRPVSPDIPFMSLRLIHSSSMTHQ